MNIALFVIAVIFLLSCVVGLVSLALDEEEVLLVCIICAIILSLVMAVLCVVQFAQGVG